MKDIPKATFGEIVVTMRGVASGAATAVELAQAQPWAQGPGTQAELANLAVDAAIAGQLAMLFAALEPHEELVRDFLAGLLAVPVDMAAERERRRA